MSQPLQTFELVIQVPSETKPELLDFLHSQEVYEYVEGTVDGLDLDYEFGTHVDLTAEFIKLDASPVSIYKYDRTYLEGLKIKVESAFKDRSLSLHIQAMPTQIWTDGWKEHFKPIHTERFIVLPPWCKEDQNRFDGKKTIVIEPGMAFGTGQHDTTQLCLKMLEKFSSQYPIKSWTILDVGTGTGVLACAAFLLGFKHITASDIDPDAVNAAEQNFNLNTIDTSKITLKKGDVLEEKAPYDVIVANILFPVLEILMPKFSVHIKSGGHLIVSGILTQDMKSLSAIAAKFGLRERSFLHSGDWAAVEYTRT